MNRLIKKALPVIFVLLCLPVPRILNAGIIDREGYSIPPEIKYKKALIIAVLPFTGKLSHERKYVAGLTANYISERILSYKKIMIPGPVTDFKRNAFDSTGNAPDTAKGSDGPVFLTLEQADKSAVRKLLNETANDTGRQADMPDPAFAPGNDIIIKGEIVQNGNNLKASLKVFNRFYGRIYDITGTGTFRNIEKFLDYLSLEVNKAIITRYAYLSVSSDEKEAAVYIDGRFFGRTDRKDILLEAGRHRVEVSKKNSGSETAFIELAEGASESLRVDLNRNDAAAGLKINIRTDPEGARVYLDSDFIGLSPVAGYRAESGTYRLRIEKEGYITKYSTIEPGGKDKGSLDITIILEKGNSEDYYFKRTSVFNYLFKASLLGAGLTSASYIYFGIQKEDESTKLRELSASDPDYNDKRRSIEDRKDKFELYRQISLYSLGAMLLSAGIFYYFDIAQDDIAIAVYYPAGGIYESGQNRINAGDLLPGFSKDTCFGISFTKSF